MTKTHWKKLHNPDYLGAYALAPGQDLVVTIRSAAAENVTGADGKKEECMVMRFENGVKPMIVNATNAKTITNVLGSPYIEDWAGQKIQLFVDKVKAFGEVVEALRVRPYRHRERTHVPPCEDCGGIIESAMGKTPSFLAKYTRKKYGRCLCAACAQKAKEAPEDAAAPEEKEVEPLDPDA